MKGLLVSVYAEVGAESQEPMHGISRPFQGGRAARLLSMLLVSIPQSYIVHRWITLDSRRN